MAKRLDSLKPGTKVRLKFHGTLSFGNAPYEETATFQGVVGEGDNRRALFSDLSSKSPFDWEAYRYKNRWAYGSSAERLSVVEVVEED